MRKQLGVVITLIALTLALTGCGLLDLVNQSRTPEPTPTPTPMPTIPPEQIIDLDELEELDDLPRGEFTVRVKEAYIAENLQDVSTGFQGVSFSDAEVELLPGIIRFAAMVTIQEVDATINVTIDGEPTIVEGLTYMRVADLRVGDEGDRSLGNIILEKTLEEAIEDVSTEHGISIPLEDAQELDGIQLEEVRVLKGELLLTCTKR